MFSVKQTCLFPICLLIVSILGGKFHYHTGPELSFLSLGTLNAPTYGSCLVSCVKNPKCIAVKFDVATTECNAVKLHDTTTGMTGCELLANPIASGTMVKKTDIYVNW